MKKFYVFIILIITILQIDLNLFACTSYLVTKGASTDGSTMISYAADSHIRYGELYFRPSREWPKDTMITLYDRGTAKPLGQIKQVAITHQVVGFMNEYQVSIGETTFDGRSELIDSLGIIDYGSLMFLALERSRTAREAIKVMVELINEYGYASSGESFSIGDANEVWILELIGKGTDPTWDRKLNRYTNKIKGAVWVAIRIPDGYVSAHANHSRITNFPLSNGKTSISSSELKKINNPEVEVIYAEDVISFARSKGYFSGEDKDFSFSEAYAPMNFGAARYCELRVWAMFNEITDGMDKYWNHVIGKDLQTRLPLYVKPNRKLSTADLMSFKRNYLQGTELDMSKDAGAGPFGSPYRWRPLTWRYKGREYTNERVTVTQQTGFSFIAQMRSWFPAPIGGVLWFGVDDAGSCVYVPFYCGITKTPKTWSEGYGDILTYKDDAAFWVFNRVAHFKYLFYDRVNVDIQNEQAYLENLFREYLPVIDSTANSLYETDMALAHNFITDFSNTTADNVIEFWKNLGNFLLVKYLDGNVKQEENGGFTRNDWGYPRSPKFPGYPNEWKKNVVEETGAQFLIGN